MLTGIQFNSDYLRKLKDNTESIGKKISEEVRSGVKDKNHFYKMLEQKYSAPIFTSIVNPWKY